MDIETIGRFYDYFNHEYPTEIRVFDEVKYPKGKSEFVTSKEEFIEKVKKYQEEKVDVYIGGRDRTDSGDDNVISSDFIFLEIDEHDIKKPCLKEKVKEFLKQNNIRIGMLGFSGKGFHFYLPHTKKYLDTEHDREMYKGLLTAFKNALVDAGIDIDTKVFNLERVSRILGSYNFKRNEQSKILIYNKDIDLEKNKQAIKELVMKYEQERPVVDKNAVELLEKYKIDKTDKWLYDLVKKGIVIREDTGGNSIVFKQTAIILTRENIPDEEMKIIAKAVANLCKGRTLSALYGWIKKCKNNEIYENYILELNNFIREGNYDLTPYPLTPQEIKDIRDYNQQQESKNEDSISNKVESICMKDFLSGKEKKERPILKPFIPERSIVTIFGEPASLKSILGDYIAACVSTGKKFLDRYPLKKRATLILSTENSERTDKKRLKAIFKGMKVNPKRRNTKNLRLFICGRRQISLFSDKNYFEKLKENIQEHKVKLLVIDTLSPMMRELNDNNAGEVVTIFNDYLFPLIDEFGLSILIIMHSQKSGKDFLGSVKYKASCDSFFEALRDSEDNSILSLLCHKSREGENNIKMRVGFETKKDLLHKINFTFLEEYSGKQSPKNKNNNPVKEEAAKEMILGFLQDNKAKYGKILEHCISNGISKITARRAMNKLFESNEIRFKQGKEGGYYIP